MKTYRSPYLKKKYLKPEDLHINLNFQEDAQKIH